MRVSIVRVLVVLVVLSIGVAAEAQVQQKSPTQEKKVAVVQVNPQLQEQSNLVGDLASMKGITEGALAGVLDGLISWDTDFGESAGDGHAGETGGYGGYGEGGPSGGIDQDTWNQSGLGDELGDYNDYGSDQERQDAIDKLAWEQSGAADSTGKDWDDFDNDAERAEALEKEAEKQEKGDGDSSDDESTKKEEDKDDSDSEGIIGKQFPLTQPVVTQMQVQGLGADQISARTQVRIMLAQLLRDKNPN
ncbi:MAG: hypothetical protein GY906_23330 [bacterium]|nr:hypothetical protein [bacterium]